MIWADGQRDAYDAGVPLITVGEIEGDVLLHQEGFFFPKKGKKRRLTLDSVIEEDFIDTPTGKRLRSQTVDGIEVYRAYFDGEGRKIRMIQGGKVTMLSD